MTSSSQHPDRPETARPNPDRLWNDIMALAAITDPERPFTRRSFSPRYLEGRRWLAERFTELGLRVRIDAAGNLIGRLDGTDPSRGVVAIGSHTDTVPSGGRFDGITGVVVAMELVRALAESGVRLRHSLEIVDFLAEEPSEYGLSCVGSRGMCGLLDATMLDLKEPGGEKLADALRRMGGDPDCLGEARRSDIAAFLELHIEQGRVLEERRLPIGIVSAIVGIRRLAISFAGSADHAGTTPMDLRRDALVAAAATVTSVRRLADSLSAGDEYFVATVGFLAIEPNASNVVPGRCKLVVDIRTTNPALTRRFVEALGEEASGHAASAGLSAPEIVTLSDGAPVSCDPSLRAILGEVAEELGLGAVALPSGAGHDAAFMSRICPSAMVFVPCREGRSHAPEEWAEATDLAAGASVLVGVVLRWDGSMAS